VLKKEAEKLRTIREKASAQKNDERSPAVQREKAKKVGLSDKDDTPLLIETRNALGLVEDSSSQSSA